MTTALQIIENAMRADAEALRTIGQNIANAEVTAYRRQIPVHSASFESALADAMTHGAETVTPADGSMRMAFDSQAGTLRSTGQALDLALEGSGFFVVQQSGTTALTRRGDFKVQADGMLATATGALVMGESGPIHVGNNTATFDLDGTVRTGEDVIDRLRIVHVADEAALSYLGNGLYASTHDLPVQQDGHASVRQGFLETSNVSPVNEMMQMMETLRHFEASQRFVRGYDEMLERAISELGKVG
jgi:flagellar basal-body rod protein FlgF